MKMSNKAMGNSFERQLCDLLSKHGFWAHCMTQNASGQPADIIAAKRIYHTLIDCKVVSGERFPFSRAEDNQRSAMDSFYTRTGFPCWFALLLPDGEIRFLSHLSLLWLEDGENMRSISVAQMDGYTNSFEEWLEIVKEEIT